MTRLASWGWHGLGDSGHADSGVGADGTGDVRAYRGVSRLGFHPPMILVLAAWQRPYLNIFKHFHVEEWKRSAKEGDVASLTVTGPPWGGGHWPRVDSADPPPSFPGFQRTRG